MKLSVQIEFDKMLELKTGKISVSVGRAPQCDLVIPHDSISRNHCQIEFINGEFFITDTGSSNGTFIDGVRLQTHDRVKYKNTQHLKLGRLECEVSDIIPEEKTSDKVINKTSSPTGDSTSTLRIGRIDLSKPMNAEEMAKKVKPKGPRNPITDELQNDQVEVVESKRTYIIMFIIVLSGLIWLLIPIFLK